MSNNELPIETIAELLLLEAQKFSSSVKLSDVSQNSITLVFTSVPSYDEQLQLQRVIHPDAQVTKNIRVWGFQGEDFKSLTVRF